MLRIVAVRGPKAPQPRRGVGNGLVRDTQMLCRRRRPQKVNWPNGPRETALGRWPAHCTIKYVWPIHIRPVCCSSPLPQRTHWNKERPRWFLETAVDVFLNGMYAAVGLDHLPRHRLGQGCADRHQDAVNLPAIKMDMGIFHPDLSVSELQHNAFGAAL